MSFIKWRLLVDRPASGHSGVVQFDPRRPSSTFSTSSTVAEPPSPIEGISPRTSPSAKPGRGYFDYRQTKATLQDGSKRITRSDTHTGHHISFSQAVKPHQTSATAPSNRKKSSSPNLRRKDRKSTRSPQKTRAPTSPRSRYLPDYCPKTPLLRSSTHISTFSSYGISAPADSGLDFFPRFGAYTDPSNPLSRPRCWSVVDMEFCDACGRQSWPRLAFTSAEKARFRLLRSVLVCFYALILSLGCLGVVLSGIQVYRKVVPIVVATGLVVLCLAWFSRRLWRTTPAEYCVCDRPRWWRQARQPRSRSFGAMRQVERSLSREVISQHGSTSAA